jgi:molybdopterin converting factor subunit 1
MAVRVAITSWNKNVMRIKVLYFATFRDLTGLRKETINLAEESTVADFMKRLLDLHPAVEKSLPSAVIAINREFAFPEDIIHDQDEIAIFPPVSGGEELPSIHVQITDDPLDLNAALALIIRPSTGAACVFTGVVRGSTVRGEKHETISLEYEAYQPMAEEKLKQVAREIKERWSTVEGIAIIQRVGHFTPGTPSVIVACAASHRDSGVFEAARYGIDRVKEIVPVWKKEIGLGGEYWVEGEYKPHHGDRET